MLVITVKTTNEYKLDPIILTFLYCMEQNFKFFFFGKYWPNDGFLRQKLVANLFSFIFIIFHTFCTHVSL